MTRWIGSLEGFSRRVVMCCVVTGGLVLLLVTLPITLPVVVVADLVTGPRRMRFSRLLAMGINYLALETVGIVVAIALWIGTGFGLAMQTRWSQRLHHLVQLWWTRQVMSATERWLKAEIIDDGADLLTTGNVIICARHASFFDAVVPAVLIGRTTDEVPLRHVLKKGLAFDPCLDIYGSRLPNHFVDRLPDNRGAELDAIGALGAELDGAAGVIFPEGTFHSEARAERIRARVGRRHPERLARIDKLRHLLPPHPGGTLAMLRAAAGADLAFVAHTGFEPFGSFRAIIANVPFDHPIRAKVWRVPATDIPDDDEARLVLIDRWWQTMDDWITEHRRHTPPVGKHRQQSGTREQ
ncbi:MAG: 1-acyl-sn-glycerol-3-phosphate acyltransferase [Acidimicrobiales bacterium]